MSLLAITRYDHNQMDRTQIIDESAHFFRLFRLILQSEYFDFSRFDTFDDKICFMCFGPSAGYLSIKRSSISRKSLASEQVVLKAANGTTLCCEIMTDSFYGHSPSKQNVWGGKSSQLVAFKQFHWSQKILKNARRQLKVGFKLVFIKKRAKPGLFFVYFRSFHMKNIA